MKLPTAHPAYKPSGVLWLGAVPEHWEVRKLRSILAETTERVILAIMIVLAIAGVMDWTK